MAKKWAFFGKKQQDCAIRPQEKGPSLSFQELEPRIAFDAALGATVADGLDEQTAQTHLAGQAPDHQIVSDGAYDVEPTAMHERARNELSDMDQLEAALADLKAISDQSREIVFIDSRIDNLDQLLAGIDPGHDVILLDPDRDGLEQIADILSGRSNIDAIHLIGHGSAGHLQLGDGMLNAASMRAEHADELAVIAQALGDKADILIYGCNFAQGPEGRDAASLLAELTGADVAASDDLTGHGDLGADWDLEVQIGQIEASIVLSESAQHGWFGSLATYTVTNANDTGTGSLRWAIESANANAGADTINFDISGSGVHQIDLSTALPTITGQVTINGGTESDYAFKPLIFINGQGLSGNGLQFSDAANNSTVRALAIGGFTGHGIHINGADNMTILRSYIGLDTTGNNKVANGQHGIYLDNGSIGTVIGGSGDDLNVISGNGGSGIFIDGGSNNTQIRCNIIGLNALANVDIGNTGNGVQVGNASLCTGTQIGSGNDGDGNIISGNDSNGILLFNALNTKIQGNRIGTNLAGTADFGNTFAGIALVNQANSTYIGTDLDGTRDAFEGNLISGNGGAGIHVWGENVDGNLIYGNKIGVNLSATSVLGNDGAGVQIGGGADANVVGSVTSHGGNIIGGNGGAGVEILSSGTTHTVVDANYIGTNASGADLGNTGAGIRIAQGASQSVIGGGGNVIRFNNGAGVSVEDAATADNAILRNTITDNETFAIDLGNDGASSNDESDDDSGPNSMLNAPVFGGVNTDGVGSVNLSGSLRAEPNSYYRIEFYASSGLNSNGHVQAQTYIGFVNVATNSEGVAVFNSAISAIVSAGSIIAATTTRTNSSYTHFTATSELSSGLVANNIAPNINSNSGAHAVSVSIPEGSTAVATVVAIDADGDTPVYRVAGGVDASLFEIDSSTGALTFISSPDHGNPQDSDTDNIYEVTIEVNDGKGGIDLQYFSVTVAAVANGDPVIGNIDGDVINYREGAGITLLDQDENATLTDSDSANFDGGRLQISFSANGLASQDTLLIRNQGTGPGQIGYTGGNVTYEGLAIGIFSGGSSASPLIVNFNVNATPEAVQALLRNIGYFNTNFNDPDTSPRTISIDFQDGDGGNSATRSLTVNVDGVNDPPSASVSLLGETKQNSIMSISYTITDPDGMGPVTVQWQRDGVDIPGATGSSYQLTEADVGHRIRVVMTYTDGGGTSERIETHALGPVTNVNDAPTGRPIITGSALEGQILNAYTGGIADADGLGSFNYQWMKDGVDIAGETGSTYAIRDSDAGSDITVKVTYTDGHGTAEGPLVAVSRAVQAVNDAPTITVPGANLSAVEQVASAIQGMGFSINDVDDNGGTMTLRLSVNEGNLTITSGSSGVIINSGNGSGSVLISGTRYQLNTLLSGGGGSGISYLNPLNAPSLTVSLTMTVNDGGNTGMDPGLTGDGSSEEVTHVHTIDITPVNDPMGLLNMTMTGAAQQNSILTINYALNDPDGMGPVTVQWQRDGVDISGATGNSYQLTEADVGHRVGAVISYTDAYGTRESYSTFAFGPVTNVNDAPTGVPVINGVAEEDSTLSVDVSSIADADGMGSISYQWLKDGVAISGATGSSYVLGDNDVGAQISVRVSYTDGHGTAESLTSAASTITGINDAPTLSGPSNPLVAVEQVDMALQGTGFSISDIDDNGGTMTLRLSVSEGLLTVGAGSSGITVLSGNGTATILVSGTKNQLNALLSGAGGSLISYRNPLDAPSTSATLTLTVNDGGNSGRDPGTSGDGASEEASLSHMINIAPVNDPVTGSISLTGETRQNGIMTLNHAINDPDGMGSVTIQWQRDGVDIPGANGNSYRLTQDDVGHRIRAVVSYIDAYGTHERLETVSLGPVQNINDAPTGAPSILGTAEENQTLSVDTSAISDADGVGSLSYQWMRDGVAISGATGANYSLGDQDVGSRISVRVSYIDGYGASESVISGQTATIANVNDSVSGRPDISGLAEQHQTLHAHIGAMQDDDGMGAVSYQWYRDGQAISGATNATYQLNHQDIGAHISVMVSFVDAHGNLEQSVSAQTKAVAKYIEPTGPEIIDPPITVPEEGGAGPSEPTPAPTPEPEITEPDITPDGSLVGNKPNGEKEEAPKPREVEKSAEDAAQVQPDDLSQSDEDAGQHAHHGTDNGMRFKSMSAELRTKLEVVRFNLGKVDPVVFYQAMDSSMDSLNRTEQVFGAPQVKITMSMGAVLSAGFVTWALRGGAILSALMSTMPAWRGFDPMVILSNANDLTGKEDENDLSHAERVFDASSLPASTKSSPSSLSNGRSTGSSAGSVGEQGTN